MLFTRYPKAGNTKTRLIPHLGATQAAELQRWMTSSVAGELKAMGPDTERQIHFAGGCRTEMQTWLGRQFRYIPQMAGNLGNRLHQAFVGNFQSGMNAVVAIGADCPDLKQHHLDQALQQLQTHDLVLGPAVDGGYYLIGLRQSQPALFKSIPWGTGEVFERTVAIANQLNLSIATLETLRDIDRPEDLQSLNRVPICL